jgi:hypothetical protein
MAIQEENHYKYSKLAYNLSVSYSYNRIEKEKI